MSNNNAGITQKAKEYYDKGTLAFEKKNYDYAMELFTQALVLKADFVDARHMLRLAEKKKAEEKPPSAISNSLNKIKATLLVLKGSLSESKNQPQNAIDQYEKALRDDPNNVNVLTKLAKILLKQNYKLSAIKTFEEILDVDKKNITALKNLGQLYVSSEEYQKARDCYENILKIHPHDTEAERGLKNLDAWGTIRKSFGQEAPPPP